MPCYTNSSTGSKDKLKAGISQTVETVYERYISSMTFSKDDKYFSLCLRNGPNKCIVHTYDMMIKGNRLSSGSFDFVISKILYMPRDN